MSAFILPRWQRTALRWFLQRMIRKNGRPLPCERCLELVHPPHQLDDALWDMMVTCPHCGHATSLMDLAADWGKTPEEKLAEGRIAAVEPPASTRITVENTGSSRTWTLPAKGGWNPLLGFGVIWLVFTCAMLGLAFSKPLKKDLDLPSFLLVALFPAAGLGMIYGGLRMTYTHHVLTVDGVELIHERRMFGSVKRKSLPLQDISSVELVVFYSENYKPIHGIEIKAGSRKVRFGSALTPEEKAWLCEELRSAVSLRHTAAASPASSHSAASLRDTSPVLGAMPASRINIQRHGQGCVVHVAPGGIGKGIMIVGAFFVAVPTIMIIMGSRMWMPASEGAPWPFMLLWNGFNLFWCGGVACFGIMGLGVLLAGWRMLHTHYQITASPDALQVLEICGRQQHETLVPASEVQDIRVGRFQTVSTSSSNQQATETRHRAVIVLSDRIVGFGGGCNLHELSSVTTALSQALGRE